VLVGEDFTVYVTDFGFARIKEKGGDGGNTQSTLGPVRHMSPESLKERRYSEKSDVYSFGVLLYEVRVVSCRVVCVVCVRVRWLTVCGGGVNQMWMREAPYMGTGMDLLQIALRVMNEGLRPPVPPNAPPALQYASSLKLRVRVVLGLTEGTHRALLERCWKADPTERPDLAGVLVALKDLYCEL
jgi:serine/threonine protein kinase